MDEKPQFWEFYRAITWRKRKQEYFHIIDKESGTPSVYAIPKSLKYWDYVFRLRDIVYIIALLLLGFGIASLNLFCDFVLFYILLEIAVYRILYQRMSFEALKDDWALNGYEYEEGRLKRAGKVIGLILMMLIFIFAIFNSYSFAYLRYAAGGRSNVNVTVKIDLPGQKVIALDGSPSQKLIFKKTLNGDDEVSIVVKTVCIPGIASISLNGDELKADYSYGDSWLFWENEYFKLNLDYYVPYDKFSESNILELKNGAFDKIWTFTVEQG